MRNSNSSLTSGFNRKHVKNERHGLGLFLLPVLAGVSGVTVIFSLFEQCTHLLIPAAIGSDTCAHFRPFTGLYPSTLVHQQAALFERGVFGNYFQLAFHSRKQRQYTHLPDNLTSHQQPAALPQSSQVFPVNDTVPGLIPIHGKLLVTPHVYWKSLPLCPK